MASNLYDYYTSKGQALPSVTDRQEIASKAGITGYTGTAEQNTTLLGYLDNLPNQGGTNTMTSDNLSPEKPIDLKQNTPDTSATGINGSISSLLETTKANVKADQTSYDKKTEELAKVVKEGGDTSAFKEQTFRDQGVDTKKKIVDNLTSQIEQEQKSTLDKIEQVRKTFQGTTGGLNAEIERITRESSNKLANYGIALSASTRNYQTSYDIADRLITSNADKIKADIQSRQFVLQQLGTKLATEKANAFTLQIKAIDNETSLVKDAIKTGTDGMKDGSIDPDAGSQALQDLISGKISLSEYYKKIGADSSNITTGSDISGYDITSYATDPTHEQKVLSIYNTIGDITNAEDASATIKAFSPESPITGQMVMDSASKYGVDPKLVIALMQQDSNIGTQGLAVKTKNAGNVGNTDSGATQTFANWGDGVDAVAKWLSTHKAVPTNDYIYGDFTSTLQPQELNAFNSLRETDKSQIMQLVTGDALMTDLVKSRGLAGTKEINRLVGLAQKVDPSFSLATNKIRYEYRKNWELDAVKGNVGARTAINTALGHLADLKEKANALPEGTLNKLNSVKNVLSKEFGDPAVTNFRINLNALGAELARVYKGGVPDAGEIKEWQNALAESFSKSQFDGAFNTASELLTSKITALRYGYKSTMGREYDNSLIDPEKKQHLLEVGISPDSIASENTPAQPPKTEGEAEARLNQYTSLHPEKSDEISSLIKNAEKTLGRPITSLEFLQTFPEYSQ